MTRGVPAGVVNTAFAAMFSRLGKSASARTLLTVQAWAQASHAVSLSAGVPIKTAVPQHVLDAAYDNTFASQPLQFGQAHSHKVGAAFSPAMACM